MGRWDKLVSVMNQGVAREGKWHFYILANMSCTVRPSDNLHEQLLRQKYSIYLFKFNSHLEYLRPNY
jgi:hypothetical protein